MEDDDDDDDDVCVCACTRDGWGRRAEGLSERNVATWKRIGYSVAGLRGACRPGRVKGLEWGGIMPELS